MNQQALVLLLVFSYDTRVCVRVRIEIGDIGPMIAQLGQGFKTGAQRLPNFRSFLGRDWETKVNRD